MLRTRPPRSTPEEARARLACIRHAASVDPEPGSNSPPMIPKDQLTLASRDAEASGPRRVLDPEGPCDPEGSLAACDGHALCWLAIAVCESERQPSTPVTRSPEPTLRSLRLRHPTRCRARGVAASCSSVRGASLSTCCSRFGARRAYSTPRPLSRVTGDERLDSASAAPSSRPGCPGRFGRVGPSLKEPRKVTTERLVCQVDGCRVGSPDRLSAPHLATSNRTRKSIRRRTLCQANVGDFVAAAFRKSSQCRNAARAAVVPSGPADRPIAPRTSLYF